MSRDLGSRAVFRQQIDPVPQTMTAGSPGLPAVAPTAMLSISTRASSSSVCALTVLTTSCIAAGTLTSQSGRRHSIWAIGEPGLIQIGRVRSFERLLAALY